MWVDPNFKAKAKSKAALLDMNMLDFTSELAVKLDDITIPPKKKRDRRGFYDPRMFR